MDSGPRGLGRNDEKTTLPSNPPIGQLSISTPMLASYFFVKHVPLG